VSGRKTIEKIDFAELRTIGDVAAALDLPAHVLRFWETRFREIRPVKRAGGRRVYRPGDIVLVAAIRTLLYDDGYTIRGVQRLIREEGVDAIIARAGRRDAPQTPETARADMGLEAPAPLPPPDQSAAWPPPPETGTPAPAVLPPAPTAVERDARLRRVLAEIEECRRLLALTRR
jgi:DNA-binding transcriptional MerR regulator